MASGRPQDWLRIDIESEATLGQDIQAYVIRFSRAPRIKTDNSFTSSSEIMYPKKSQKPSTALFRIIFHGKRKK